MRIALFSIALMVSIASAAQAGRLGVCYRCEFKVHGQTLETYSWSGATGSGATKPGLALDILNRTKCGGGAVPDKVSRAPAHKCDAAAGIIRWTNNDPFDPVCQNGGENHDFHIGGENLDLVVVVEQGDTFRSGSFYRVQDGKGYSCSNDVAGGSNFSTLRYGRNRDLLDIYVVTDDGVARNQYRIEDGTNHAVVTTPSMVGRLYGRNKDVISLYNVASDGTISVLGGIRIKDGTGYSLTALGNDIGVTYGNNHDVRGRFCYEQGAWKQYLGSRDGSFPPSCDPLPPADQPYTLKPGIDFLRPGQTHLP